MDDWSGLPSANPSPRTSVAAAAARLVRRLWPIGSNGQITGRVVDIDLGDGTNKRSVTAGTPRAATVLRALGIDKIDPPTPPKPGETIM